MSQILFEESAFIENASFFKAIGESGTGQPQNSSSP